MKTLIKKISILAAIILIICLLVHQFVLPFAWGDSTQYTKIKHFEKVGHQYNTIVIGGSLEYRQIDPYILDSTAKANGIDMRTYNFAIDGHNFVQQMNDVEYYIDKWGDNLDYIVLSLSSESLFLKNQLHQIKGVQWVNPKSALLASKINMELPMPLKKQVQFTYFYGMSLVENTLLFGLGDEAVRFITYDKFHRDTAYLGKRMDGFYPYDDEETHLMLDFEWEEKLLKKSHNDYIEQKWKRDSLMSKNIAQFEGRTKDKKLITAELKKYKEIIDKARKKGINVYVSVPPRARTSYAILMEIYNALPSDSKVEVADPRKYPELYKVENSYNFHHLNAKGAQIYSEIVAKKIVELEKKKSKGQ
ncbi:MAG: hypothetical protein K1X55_12195 [Chitinophagales bacterium]|nr:hypothetical protein [Chitinophagales bacterium]